MNQKDVAFLKTQLQRMGTNPTDAVMKKLIRVTQDYNNTITEAITSSSKINLSKIRP